jgi:hypothetical protein
MTPLLSEGIGARFRREQEYISQFVDFLAEAARPSSAAASYIAQVLRRHGIEADRVESSEGWPLYIPRQFDELRPEIDTRLNELQHEIRGSESYKGIDARSELGEWIMFFMEHVPNNPSAGELEWILAQAIEQQDKQKAEYVTESNTPEFLSREQLNHAIRVAFAMRRSQQLDELFNAREQLRREEMLRIVAAPDGELNVYRQGFILLMTAFDAAVFDLAREALRAGFFSNIRWFAGKTKLGVEEFGRYADFAEFRDAVIENQLRGMYLQDILRTLRGVGLFSPKDQKSDPYVRLRELVARRNLHIHNRGIVDDRYLESDERGRPKYNIFHLETGQLAVINEQYWQMANQLCNDAVEEVAGWAADSRGPVPVDIV